MLFQLSSPHDNGECMIIHPKGMKHDSSIVIVARVLNEGLLVRDSPPTESLSKIHSPLLSTGFTQEDTFSAA